MIIRPQQLVRQKGRGAVERALVPRSRPCLLVGAPKRQTLPRPVPVWKGNTSARNHRVRITGVVKKAGRISPCLLVLYAFLLRIGNFDGMKFFVFITVSWKLDDCVIFIMLVIDGSMP